MACWPIAVAVLCVQVLAEPIGNEFVGVGYNLLTGNPDGGNSARGGIDPGLLYTRKVFDVTSEHRSNQVVFEQRHSCTRVQSTHVFYGAKSYQDKLGIDVQSSGSANAAIVNFAFSLSTRFSKAVEKTNQKHQVFQDDQEVCNLGRARFAEELARADDFSISRNFAASVCRLPEVYNQTQYMAFLDRWGTHITMEVELGTKQVKRYVSSLSEFVEHVRKSVSGGVHLGGSYMGFGASLSVDFSKFKASDSYKMTFGKYQYSLSAGSEERPEPIGIKVVTMDTALRSKYWQDLSGFTEQHICSDRVSSSLPVWRSNVIKAISEYAAFKMAPLPRDPALRIPVTWPAGTYGLMKPKTGCPSGRMRWEQGWRYEDFEDSFNHNQWSHNIHLAGSFGDNIRLEFCIKGVARVTEFDMTWPAGDYCLLKYGDCPAGFTQGYIYSNDEDFHNHNKAGGVLPDGDYNRDTKTYYCCRNDGLPTTEIALPNDRPFYLLRYTRGCQRVVGMVTAEETLQWDTEDIRFRSDSVGGAHPLDDHGSSDHRLHYCYYFRSTHSHLIG